MLKFNAYLKWTAQLFIPLMRFLLRSLVSSSFLVLMRYFFSIFLSSPPVWWCPLSTFPNFRFSELSDFSLIWLFYSFHHLLFSAFHYNQGIFFYAKYIPISSLYILAACVRISNSFSFSANRLMSSMYIRWWTFSCNLWNLNPPVHFLSMCMWLRGIITITNSNGDSKSLGKIPLWIFTSAKLFPPTVSSTLQFSMVFLIKFVT